MTARETLEQLIDRAEVMLMSRSYPPNAENLAADLDERTQLGYDLIAALRAAPAPEPEHVCGGCGYKWNWPVPSPIELCGDCWRKTWQILRGAAPAPEGETPMPRCVVCRTEYPTTGQQAGPVAGVWGKNFMVCRLCVDAARDAKRKRNAPASPAPTPEGRETNWLAGALADAKATAANILTPEQVQALRDSHEQAIRAAQAETLREAADEITRLTSLLAHAEQERDMWHRKTMQAHEEASAMLTRIAGAL
jgi:hypothetical protein